MRGSRFWKLRVGTALHAYRAGATAKSSVVNSNTATELCSGDMVMGYAEIPKGSVTAMCVVVTCDANDGRCMRSTVRGSAFPDLEARNLLRATEGFHQVVLKEMAVCTSNRKVDNCQWDLKTHVDDRPQFSPNGPSIGGTPCTQHVPTQHVMKCNVRQISDGDAEELGFLSFSGNKENAR